MRPRLLLVATATLALVPGLILPPVIAAAEPTTTTRAASVKDPKLAAKLGALMKDSRVQKAGSGTAVMDVSSRSMLYSRYAGTLRTPASNLKLFTAAAALDTLGPDFTFHTDVVRRGKIAKSVLTGNLYLKGYGDPTSMRSDYASLARQVRAAGVKTVTGNLAVDTSYFDNQTYNPHWSKSYAGDYYAARIRPLTIAPNTDYDSGTIIVNVRPGKKNGKAKISTTPADAIRSVTIKNKTTTTSKGGSIDIDRTYGSNTITVSGKIKTGAKTSSDWVTVDRPERVAADIFRSELRKAGVSIRGVTKAMKIPSGKQKRLARDRSMTLSKLSVPFLKLSNNMHAETLTKTMGKVAGRSGSWSEGLKITKRFVASTGASTKGLELVDGSGLSRADQITPRSVVTVLTKIRTKKWFGSYDRALPVAGDKRRMVGGTLSKRMRNTKAAGNAHAKTGSLTGVTALSGYVRGADKRLYAFSMLSNYSSVSPRPVEDKLVIALAGWRR